MARSNKDKSLEQTVADAQAAQKAAPAAPVPSFFEVKCLLSDKTSDGMRRKMYFRFHPVAQYATAMDVATWLGGLASQYAARLG